MTLVNIGTVVRKWSDVSHKVYAAGVGGGSSALVLTLLSNAFPDWHPGTLTVGAITAAVSVIAAYWKGDRVALNVQAGDEETLLTLSDLPEELRTQLDESEK